MADKECISLEEGVRRLNKKINNPMSLETAIKHLETEYEKAKRLDFVINPIAYALYQVWKMADGRKG